MDQTTPIGLGRTAQSRIDGYQLGLSRTGDFNAMAALAWGSNMQIGRVAVYSPEYNAAVAAGLDNPNRSVMIPDATGTYVTDPATGQPLSTNATLLAQAKVAGKYLVAGIIMEGDRCDDSRCDRPQSWPLGDHDNLHEWNFTQDRRPVTLGISGFFRVRIGEDINVGDSLAFADATDDEDPSIGLIGLGAIVKAENGVQNLPTTWKVVTGGKAGQSCEIYVLG